MTTISKELPIAAGGEKQKPANSSSDYSGHRFLRSRIDSAHVRVEVIQLTRSSTDLKVGWGQDSSNEKSSYTVSINSDSASEHGFL